MASRLGCGAVRRRRLLLVPSLLKVPSQFTVAADKGHKIEVAKPELQTFGSSSARGLQISCAHWGVALRVSGPSHVARDIAGRSGSGAVRRPPLLPAPSV